MNCPDIERLILLYAIYPEYQFIKSIGIMVRKRNIAKYEMINKYPLLCINPRACKYIKHSKFQDYNSHQLSSIQFNPNPRIIALFLKYLNTSMPDKFLEKSLMFYNDNNEYVEQIFSTYFNGDILKISGDCFHQLFSCPSDKILDKCFDYLNKYHMNCPKRIGSNKNSRAVDYVLENFDSLMSSSNNLLLDEIADNPNPRIIKKMCGELEDYVKGIKYASPSDIKRWFATLSENPDPQVIELLKKYPTYIDPRFLINNSNPEAIRITLTMIHSINNREVVFKDPAFEPLGTRGLTHNPHWVKHYMKLQEKTEGVNNIIMWDLSNPDIFEVSITRTTKKIKLVKNLLEI